MYSYSHYDNLQSHAYNWNFYTDKTTRFDFLSKNSDTHLKFFICNIYSRQTIYW